MNKQIEISEEITEAKSEYKLRVNPTFVFFCHFRRKSQTASANLVFNQAIIINKNSKIIPKITYSNCYKNIFHHKTLITNYL